MKLYIICIIIIIGSFGYAQQYDSVVFENDSIDSNNNAYKIGNVYIFDYEIIENNMAYKLNENSRKGFELVPSTTDSLRIDKIHVIVRPILDNEKRTNENQTQISFLQEPDFSMVSSTGVVDNDANVWIHPIRSGFFEALETCPFPYIKKPLSIGNEWEDEMLIGDGWSDKKWGEWTGDLVLKYNYKITGVDNLDTNIGSIECFIIESTATSRLGTTTLKSYFSASYGFVRYEYELLTGIQVNMWLVDFKMNQEFDLGRNFFMTKKYIKQ